MEIKFLLTKMLIRVKVFPNEKKEMVTKQSADSFEVKVKAKAERGQANRAVRSILADFLDLPEQKLRLVRGGKSRNKLFETNL